MRKIVEGSASPVPYMGKSGNRVIKDSQEQKSSHFDRFEYCHMHICAYHFESPAQFDKNDVIM